MADDLQHSKLASLPPEDLSVLLVLEAARREYELVVRLYGGLGGVNRTWLKWLSSTSPLQTPSWKERLLGALGQPVSISITDPPMTNSPPEPDAPADASSSTTSPTPSPNALPAIFLVPAPTLFQIRNLLQAMAIPACLLLIAFPSSLYISPPHPPSLEDKELFASRIWDLLVGEVDRGGFAQAETKLVNLEDEVGSVIRQRSQREHSKRGGSELSSDEARVREHVRRLVKTDDPVFALLMRKFVAALAEWLASLDRKDDTHRPTRVPEQMRAGRKAPTTAPHQPHIGGLRDSVKYTPMSPIQGIDTQVLKKACEDVAQQLGIVTQWVEAVWDEVIEQGVSTADASAIPLDLRTAE